MLDAGDGVGIPRSDVHYVITEYGIAYLFGKGIRERALALIDIAHPAHPAHRAARLDDAKRLGYVPAEQFLASQATYPVQEERMVRLKTGVEVLIRPARVTDATGLSALFHRMTDDDRYTRFFRRVRQLSFLEIQTLCNVNHETEVAFVAVAGPRENETIIGSGCYFVNPTTHLAEIAFMVAREWQGSGLGTALQARLQDYAMARGIRGFNADILSKNARMLSLVHHAKGRITTDYEDGEARVTVLFAEGAAA
jgi:RimJ/RimL family protein N-acetyltransferase